jgi:hypothetical protein
MPLVRCRRGAEYTRAVARSALSLWMFAFVVGGGRLARADTPPATAPPAAAPSSAGAPNAATNDTPAQVQVRGTVAGQTSASESSVGQTELALRPRLRAEDVLEAVPGLFTVQHSGGAKAQQ